MPPRKLKTDRYRNARGGRAAIEAVVCSSCGQRVLLYQKDGIGQLRRCYFNRILEPAELALACRDEHYKQALRCTSCGALIGVPMRHTDGRPAFRLLPGAFLRDRNVA